VLRIATKHLLSTATAAVLVSLGLAYAQEAGSVAAARAIADSRRMQALEALPEQQAAESRAVRERDAADQARRQAVANKRAKVSKTVNAPIDPAVRAKGLRAMAASLRKKGNVIGAVEFERKAAELEATRPKAKEAKKPLATAAKAKAGK
jgi:hypothetical protein